MINIKQAIDVNFYPPSNKDQVEQGVLYIPENENNYLEINRSQTAIQEEIAVLYATSAVSGEKYTIVNARFLSTNFLKSRYRISELYKGDFLGRATEVAFTECELKIGGLTEWLNQNCIDVKSTKTVNTNDDFSVSYPLSDNIRLQLTQFAARKYDKNQVTITNDSVVKFIAEHPLERLNLYKYAKGLKSFLMLFSRTIPKIHCMNFGDSEGKTIECIFNGDKNYSLYPDSLLQYNDLKPDLQSAFYIFYANLDNFMKVLDLFVESVKNKTVEISFLNLTAALELFHKSFLEKKNEDRLSGFVEALFQEGVLNEQNRNKKKWIQITRCYDLLNFMGDIPYVSRNFKNLAQFCEKLTDSRNYFTHWEDKEKLVWSKNELYEINDKIRTLLRGIVLKQLGISKESINKLMSNEYALFYNSDQKNEYSMNYQHAGISS